MKKLFSLYCAFLTCSCTNTAHQWKQEKDTVVSYVFAPGILTSEIMLANYCPQFTASTGERISSTSGINVIQEPVSSNNFPEIELSNNNVPRGTNSLISHIKKIPIKLLGYAGSYMAHQSYGITVQQASHHTKRSVRMHWVDPAKINIAQEDDITHFKKTYDTHIAGLLPPNNNQVVLYGFSRGAATIFNFMALHKPPHVKAIVCEGIFDSISAITRSSTSLYSKAKKQLLRITKFDHTGIAPIDCASSISHDIPMLLVTSLRDTLVPYNSTLNIYKQLRAAGHTKVHILILKNATHPTYTCHNNVDKTQYEQTVHAFYRMYALPHIPELAESGHDYFKKQTQPPI